MFVGFVTLEGTLKFPVLTMTISTQVPVDSATTPTFRAYGNAGLMTNGTGNLSFKESGTVTGATNASPIVITSASHGLTTGMKVTVASVGGNTSANGTWTITVVSSSTFSLDTSTGNGAYTSGGTWHTTGYYTCSLDATAANGYAQGGWYDVLVLANVGSVSVAYPFRFGVI